MNNDYKKGFEDGVRCFAWWKDGVEYVGTTGKTLACALADIKQLHTFLPPGVKPSSQRAILMRILQLCENYQNCDTEGKDPAIHPDDKRRIEWIDKRISQLGIDVRQSKHHIQMRYYLELLKEEISMTEQFLSDDGQSPNLNNP